MSIVYEARLSDSPCVETVTRGRAVSDGSPIRPAEINWHMKRAQQAAALLRRGTSILDTAYEAGYFDQSHLTRSLKQFIGYTPAQIIRMSKLE